MTTHALPVAAGPESLQGLLVLIQAAIRGIPRNSAGLVDPKTLYDAGPTRYTTALPCLPTATIAPTLRRQ